MHKVHFMHIDMITAAHQLTPMDHATPSRPIAHLAVLKV